MHVTGAELMVVTIMGDGRAWHVETLWPAWPVSLNACFDACVIEVAAT